MMIEAVITKQRLLSWLEFANGTTRYKHRNRVDGSADQLGRDAAHVLPLDGDDPRVGADAFVELAVTDVECDDLGGAAP